MRQAGKKQSLGEMNKEKQDNVDLIPKEIKFQFSREYL